MSLKFMKPGDSTVYDMGTLAVKKPDIAPKTGDWLVRFFDFDGTILKSQWVVNGEDAQPPTPPLHENLIFQSWRGDYTNVDSPVDLIPNYATVDGKSWVFLELTPATGLKMWFSMYVNDSAPPLIEWGDGTAETPSGSGSNRNFSHDYPGYGAYILKVQHTASSKLLGYNSSGAGSYNFVGGANYARRQAMVGVYVMQPESELAQSLTYQNYTCKFMTLHEGITSSYSNSLSGKIAQFYPLSGNFHRVQSSVGRKQIIIPKTVANINQNAFSNNQSTLIYVCARATPPGLYSTAFTDINPLAKIYVPDASVEAYKTQTNWTVYADYIYPLSEYVSEE